MKLAQRLTMKFGRYWPADSARQMRLDTPCAASITVDSLMARLPEYEQALRVLHREAWPNATSSQRDSDLKRRFEDGLLNPEMSQFLRLHARKDDFSTTVLKA